MATAAAPTTIGENPASLMSAVWTTPSHDTIVSSNRENWLVQVYMIEGYYLCYQWKRLLGIGFWIIVFN
jgi:hypothetical protein